MSRRRKILDFPLETVIRLAREATQEAAREALAAGRTVTGWRRGRLEEFGPGVRQLSSKPFDPRASD